ncbi:MAG TPA: hypothetical protein V6C95_06345 [Coleofasciculaceae cyanobacterium]
MTQVQISQFKNGNDNQSLYPETGVVYTELSSPETEKLKVRHTLEFPQPEFALKQDSSKEVGIPALNENETSDSKTLHQSPAPASNSGLPRQVRAVFRRGGRLSEY